MAFRKDLIVDRPYVIRKGYGFETSTAAIVADDRRSGAERSLIDTGNNTASELDSRLDNAVQAFGREHPDHTGLMLARITGVLTEGVDAQYTAEYVPKPKEGYDISPDVIEVRWLHHADGTAIGQGEEPPFRTRKIPVWNIRFRHSYYQLQAPSLHTFNHDSTNVSTVTIINLDSVAPNTLLWLAPRIQQFWEGNTSIWVIEWNFAFRKDGWIEERRKEDGTIEQRDLYERTNFAEIP